MENQDKLHEQFKEAARKAEDKGFDRMEAVWNRVEEKLDRKKERRVAIWWKYSGIAAILILFIAVGTFMFRDNGNTVAPQAVPEINVTTIDTARIKEVRDAIKEGVQREEVVVNEGVIKLRDGGGSSPVPQNNNAKIMMANSGNGIYTGTVLDDMGMPIPGVSVVIRGTQTAVQTDFDGKFQIPAHKGDVLEISFIGFKTQAITANDTKRLGISMQSDATELDAAVIDIYRSTTVRQSPAAVTTLSIETIEKNRNASVIQNLQGQVAGLNIATGRGQPGSVKRTKEAESDYDKYMYENYWSLGGQDNDAAYEEVIDEDIAYSYVQVDTVDAITEKLEVNNTVGKVISPPPSGPLYVINGVPTHVNVLNVIDNSDIFDLKILKNGEAASIYGSSASHGVIVITTKQLTKKQNRTINRYIKENEKLFAQQNPEYIHFIENRQNKKIEKIQIDQEEYESFIENQFENPATAPLSTFSIDVDNASYTNIRRFLNNGQVVPKDAVRVEEMINFFKYRYPQPKGDEPFSINTEYSDAPWNPEHKLLKIGLQGKEIPSSKLPASNFVFLIDVSGSMDAANKLPLLKESMKLLVKQMRKEDRIAIVVYAGAAGLVLPSTSGAEKDKIIAALDNLSAGGSTAGGAGIELAYKTAQEHFIKGGNNRVILATDGDFNVGASSNADMQTLIEEKRKSGVFLTCLGYGMGNYKDSKLETLADKGNGNYAYIDNMQEADRFLQKEFKGSMYAIAKDVKIQIEFNPKHVQSYRLIGYENRKLRDEDFANDAIDAGELGSGHTVTALYEIIPVGVQSKAFTGVTQLKYSITQTVTTGNYNDELATIKFRHKKPDEDVSKETVQVISNKSVSLKNASGDLKFSAAVAWFGLKLRDSKLVPNKKSADIKALAKEGLANDPEGYRAEFIRLVDMVE